MNETAINPQPATVFIKPQGANSEFSSADGHDYYDYQKASGVYDKLIDSSQWLNTMVERERALRYVKDAESITLREKGILKADEVYIPNRLIDQNIRAEQPALVKYLTQSQRSIIFESSDGIPVDGKEKLENDFTLKARYLKWEIPWIQCFDGCQAHGKDSVEVLFDPRKPGNFCIEHIGPNRLIFSKDSEDIQNQEVLLIEKVMTSNQLRSMDGFNQEQVTKLINSNQTEAGQQDCNNRVYKCYFKQEGIVHVGWYGKNLDGYLKNPEPFWLGKRDFTKPKVLAEGDTVPDFPPIYEEEFRIYMLPYVVNNDPRIIELPGRCKLDEPYQEGSSALQSAMVNGAVRASNVMMAPKQNNLNIPPNDAPSMTDKVVGNGRVWNQAMDMFHTPYPADSLVQFLNALVTQNKQEQGSGISFATMNRKDSGKTATEINAALETSQELGSVQVILLSVFIREVYACCWEIYQNRVLQGKIPIKNPDVLILFGENIQADERGYVTVCTAATEYLIKSSGDVDVVQRQAHLQKLMQGWEVFGKTAIAPEFLKDIIRYAFPEDATKYINILDTGVANQADALKQLLLKVANVLKTFVTNPAGAQQEMMQPGMMEQMVSLAQQVQAAVAAPSIPGAPTTPIQEAQMNMAEQQQAA